MKPIDHIITSRVMAKMLAHFCAHSEPFGVRELSRSMSEDYRGVHIHLTRLVKAGIVEKIESENSIKYKAVPSKTLECLRGLMEGV